MKKIKTALISVYNKDDLNPVIKKLNDLNINIISTGGTKKYIEEQGTEVVAVEDISSYPSILGGRVKTLHPLVFGGILKQRDSENDKRDSEKYEIPDIDLVIVDLYPFEETIKNTDNESEIIEKIDIGGISLIRAAAKNYKDVLVVSGKEQYDDLLALIENKDGASDLDDRKSFAAKAFAQSSHYDSLIYSHFSKEKDEAFRESFNNPFNLRYGENPHQKAIFFGDFTEMFDKLHGKEISYNNLLDIDAAVSLMNDFSEKTIAVLKHNNACGLASRNNLTQAWKDALAGDPVSAFGGIIISNSEIDNETASEINKIFFEVIIAPAYSNEALEILKQKKNRIILIRKEEELPEYQFRTCVNGVLRQERDTFNDKPGNLNTVTDKEPQDSELRDMLFANKIVKHTKSNAIVLAKDNQLIASGVGQTSRVDALKQAINKAKSFNFDLNGAVMASDAFFPFKDSVEIAEKEGITAVIQPGGSIRDQESVDYCNEKNISMIFTGHRHFKH